MPGRPGSIASIAVSTSSVTAPVFAPGNFSTTRRRHWSPPVQMASPINGWWFSTTLVTSPRVTGEVAVPASPTSSGTAASSLAEEIACSWKMLSRWFTVSMNPPVPGFEASRNDRGETSRELPAVAMTCSSVAFSARSRLGSTSTCSWCSRLPQIATFATPSTPVRRGPTTQRANTDISVGVSSLDDISIIATRLFDDSG